MDYRGNLKNLLMKGKMFKIKGQGIGGAPSLRMSTGSGLRLGGTISHRPTVGRVLDGMESQFENLRVSAKKANKPNTKYKPLKFNF